MTHVPNHPDDRLYIMRGIPGSGKTTWCKENDIDLIVSADYYHLEGVKYIISEDGLKIADADGHKILAQEAVNSGLYQYDHTEIGEAHAWCFRMFMTFLDMEGTLAVDNTNPRRADFTPYVLASKASSPNREIRLVRCECDVDTAIERQKHGCPETKVEGMAEIFEDPIARDPTELIINTEE